jgi:hypothetical protein
MHATRVEATKLVTVDCDKRTKLALVHSNVTMEPRGVVKDASVYLHIDGGIYKVNVKVGAPHVGLCVERIVWSHTRKHEIKIANKTAQRANYPTGLPNYF